MQDLITLESGLATPTPDFLLGKLFMHDRPIPFGDVVGGQFGMPRDSPPGEKYPKLSTRGLRRATLLTSEAGVGKTCLAIKALYRSGLFILANWC